ncbi:ABC transporter ATP-binding protein [Desulfurococcus mucosus]|uniref:Molybdate/tungstate import ATP-binding protein WtpC n=1 Tax=Desulfurococcus mucosus (strain ATCC 35584 / DSM 2162 / JCM 9187 / O7/1) TaxID=765177 RepID=E8R8I1_DESM0|nr:ABC transporter ATP-binding protein [Desulfurococcus mucosus]ADV64807.1 ABC transporter related protein [Desulfurococcus mucosus DSM 2162]
MTRVRLEGVSKYYGAVVAAEDVNIEIQSGEFFTLLGPSGCGKTTTLRIIAGFETPDKGRVYFDDEDVTFVKPYKRNTSMVFQNYALWPHMTVYENVAYGLKLRKKELGLTDEDIRKMVKEALELVKLSGMENRYPLQLSGGQQQRVALARALVVKPRVLLLDEPLSNLDAKLRIEMREELRKLQRSLNLTTIYVIHDQVEAMSLSDRIAVMNKGRVVQVGSPKELYFKPRSLFVADFLGRSSIYPGELVSQSGEYAEARLADADIIVRGVTPVEKLPRKVSVVIRPEIIRLGGGRAEEGDTVVKGVVDFAMFLGEKVEARVKIGNLPLLVYLPNTVDVSTGNEVELTLPWRNIIILPSD